MIKKRIIFVDDDQNVLDGLRRMLRLMRNEWSMQFVSDPRNAIRDMKANDYDIIVSDLRMPVMTGLELLEWVRDNKPDMIRFVLSGDTDNNLKTKSACCAHQFIAKPCDAENLRDLISRAFSLHERLQAGNLQKALSSMRSLPVMPQIYHDLLGVLDTPQCSSRKVGQMISEDVGMSAKMLQVANSSSYCLRERIVDPVHAVVYLGLKTAKAMIFTDGIFSELKDSLMQEFSVEAIQAHCFRVGVLTDMICRSMKMPEEVIEAATMAGILHDAGKIVLVAKFADEFMEAILQSRAALLANYMAEKNRLNVTHAEIGGCLLNLWGLPDTIIEPATFHHEPWQCENDKFSIVSAVYIANIIDHQLCSALSDGWHEDVNYEYIEKLGVTDKYKQWQRKHLSLTISGDAHVS